jgi:hypothetical protein
MVHYYAKAMAECLDMESGWNPFLETVCRKISHGADMGGKEDCTLLFISHPKYHY